MLFLLLGLAVYLLSGWITRQGAALIAARRWAPAKSATPDRRFLTWSTFFRLWVLWAGAMLLWLGWNSLLAGYPETIEDAILAVFFGGLLAEGTFLIARFTRQSLIGAGGRAQGRPQPGHNHDHGHSQPSRQHDQVPGMGTAQPEIEILVGRVRSADVFGSARHFEDTVRAPGFVDAWLALDDETISLERLLNQYDGIKRSYPEASRTFAADSRVRINMLRLTALDARVMGAAELAAAADRRSAGQPTAFAPVVETGTGF